MASDEELAHYIYSVYVNKTYDPQMLYSTGIWVKSESSGTTYRRGSKIVMWIKGKRVEIEIDHHNCYCETASFKIGDSFHIYRHPLAWKIWKDYYHPTERRWKTHDELKGDISERWFFKRRQKWRSQP